MMAQSWICGCIADGQDRPLMSLMVTVKGERWEGKVYIPLTVLGTPVASTSIYDAEGHETQESRRPVSKRTERKAGQTRRT